MTVRWTYRPEGATTPAQAFIYNPDAMSNPFAARTLRHGTGWRRDHRLTTVQNAPAPHEWEFSGPIRTKSHYDQLLDLADIPGAIELTDHLGRSHRIALVSYRPEDRRPTPNHPWRTRYTMNVRSLRSDQ